MPEERRGCRAVDSPLFSLVCASLFMVCVCVCFIFLGVSFFFFNILIKTRHFREFMKQLKGFQFMWEAII